MPRKAFSGVMTACRFRKSGFAMGILTARITVMRGIAVSKYFQYIYVAILRKPFLCMHGCFVKMFPITLGCRDDDDCDADMYCAFPQASGTKMMQDLLEVFRSKRETPMGEYGNCTLRGITSKRSAY